MALAWAKSVDPAQSFCLSRFTQLGLLRILTTRGAMGADVLTLANAWAALDRLAGYWDAVLIEEPPGFEALFRALTMRDEVSPQYWADAYLAALAEGHRLTIVTFDKALAGRARGSIQLSTAV